MDSKIDNEYTADYLWNKKGIVSFLKIDSGLDEMANGVQLMKPIDDLDKLLDEALTKNIFGTKMRSVIKEDNEIGIKMVVDQQIALAKKIVAKGLVPIVEPEVDINAKNKQRCEELLKKYINDSLETLSEQEKIIFKFTLPTIDNFYEEYTKHPNVIRVLALSGGYSRNVANEILIKNRNVIASFSRALLEGLSINQSNEKFDECLASSIESIYNASIKNS
jgi:fructose-bisphosphate aldolase class I